MERARVIKELIEKSGLTQKAIAVKAGIPYTTLRSMIERGLAKAAVENVIKVCAALGITVEEMDQMAFGSKKEEDAKVDLYAQDEDWTEEELRELERYKEFLRFKRNQN